jgi:protein TonB
MSIGLHAAVLAALLVFPLVFFQVLPGLEVWNIIVSEPTPLPPVPPVAPIPGSSPVSSPKIPIRVQLGEWTQPTEIPHGIPVLEPLDLTGIDSFPSGLGEGLPGSAVGAWNGPQFPGLSGFSARTKPLLALAPPPPRARPQPILVSVMSASQLIHRVDPEYPPLARQARLQGAVKLEILVDETGNVAEVSVVSGPPLLQRAALEAVKQWRYRPTILNGEPIPVRGTVTVNFVLR